MDKKIEIKLTKTQIKQIHTALYHQWHKMTDDDGNAVNCKQSNADGTYRLLKMFEGLL